MNKKIHSVLCRIFIFLVGLSGPAVTVVLYASGENGKLNPKEILIPIAICYGFSVMIALAAHFKIKKLGRCVLSSTLIALFFYSSLFIVYAMYQSNPEVIMWLPIAFIFIGINCFPMAFLVSGSTILLMRFDTLKGFYEK